jgi:hypothetical protein
MDSFTYIQKLSENQSIVSDPIDEGDDRSQKAEISEQNDKGDEVESQLKKIATIDPLLAYFAAIINDPVQTDALVNFADGKMSYAEMRGLCG